MPREGPVGLETFLSFCVPCTNFWRSGTFEAKEKPQGLSMTLASTAIATNRNNVQGEASSQGGDHLESRVPWFHLENHSDYKDTLPFDCRADQGKRAVRAGVLWPVFLYTGLDTQIDLLHERSIRRVLNLSFQKGVLMDLVKLLLPELLLR